MGWGIGFSCKPDGRVYCTSGCDWEASQEEYESEGFWPIRPSVAEYVLRYFKDDKHCELDSTRNCASLPPRAADGGGAAGARVRLG